MFSAPYGGVHGAAVEVVGCEEQGRALHSGDAAYRWPTLVSLGLRLVDRGKAFLYRAGTVIMLVSLLLWAATNFPMHHGQPPAVQDSVVAWVGHAIEPAIRPLGFDWKIGVGLLTSIAAREVIIATLGTLNGIDPQCDAVDLQAALSMS